MDDQEAFVAAASVVCRERFDETVRLRGAAVVIRTLASGAETTIEAPAVDGRLDVGWGSDARTLVAVALAPDHQRMLVRARDGRWRTIIDEPHHALNGYVASPDGLQLAISTRGRRTRYVSQRSELLSW